MGREALESACFRNHKSEGVARLVTREGVEGSEEDENGHGEHNQIPYNHLCDWKKCCANAEMHKVDWPEGAEGKARGSWLVRSK